MDDAAIAAVDAVVQETPAAPRRGNLAAPFKPGVSGNPAGRPKGQSISAIWQKWLAEPYGTDERVSRAEALLRKLFIRAMKDEGDVRAIEVILSRAYGKPKSTVEVEGTVTHEGEVKHLHDNAVSVDAFFDRLLQLREHKVPIETTDAIVLRDE